MAFDRDVLVGAAHLAVDGVGGAVMSGFVYDQSTRTATWTFAAAAESDRLRFVLDGDAPR